jgi:hypothetical protein
MSRDDATAGGSPRADTPSNAGTAAAPTGNDPADDRYDVPPDATALACPRCGRPFVHKRHRDLHIGQAHTGLDDDERAAYEAARDQEADELRRFRILSLGLLVVIYFGFLFLYAVAG